MRQKTVLKSKRRNTIESIYTLIFVLSLIMMEPQTYTYLYKIYWPLNIIILLFFLVGYILIYQCKIRINLKKCIYVLIMITLLLLNKLVHNDPSNYYFVIISHIFIAYVVSEIIEWNNFRRNFVYIMLFICIYSLIMTYSVIAFTPFFDNIFPSFWHMGDYMKFLDTGFCFVYRPEYGELFRNYGVFREPGVFQIYIIMALILEVWYKKEKTSKFIVLIFIVAVLSTFSTTGILALIILGIVYVFNTRKININRITPIIILGLILTIISIQVPIIKENIIGSLLKLNGGNSSLARSGSFIAYLFAWLDRPIWGWGYTKGVFEAGSIYLNQFTKDNTNTIFSNYAFFGFGYGTMYLYLILKFWLTTETKKISKVLILFCILIITNSQIMIDSIILFILIFYSFKNFMYKKREERL